MIQAKVNDKYNFQLEEKMEKDMDMIQIKQGLFHILKENKSYTAELLKANPEEKSFSIRVNGSRYNVVLKDKYDDILQMMGMDTASVLKVKELKAPMPGLIVDIRIKEGDIVKKGDALIVLQAMKMENILKSPTDVTIKKIHVQRENTIEKNQLLISFS